MPTTSNFGWTTPADTDLVKDGALAIRTLGNGIDTSMAQLKGGTTGQVLSKTSNTDMAFTWVTQDDANAIQNAIVDAKGDLIAATANDTPARLAVGNNGETLVADSSTSTGLRWQGNQAAGRNTVLNGGFDIWQRGTSFTPAANGSTFGPDRWNIYRDGGAGATVSQQASGLTNFLYACRVARNSGDTSTNSIYIWQNFESQTTYPLAGKTVVLSFYARAGANYSPTSSNLGIQVYTGTGVDQNVFSGYTGAVAFLDTTQAITTTWTRYTQVFTLNSNVTEICPRFYMTPSGTAGANDWFEITGIQIEIGSVPTTFTRAGGTLAGELAACQRYYLRCAPAQFGYIGGIGSAVTTSNVFFQFPNKTTMRVTPTSVDYSGISVSPDGISSAITVSTVTFASGTKDGDTIIISANLTGATQYRPYQAYVSGATGYIGVSAEL